MVVVALQGGDGLRIHRRRDVRMAGAAQQLLEQQDIGLPVVDDQDVAEKNVS